MSDSPVVSSFGEKQKGTSPLPKSGCGCILFLGTLVALIIGVSLYQFLQIPEKIGKKQAQAMCSTLGNAVEQFQTDYHHLPLPNGPPPQGGDRDTDSATAHGFVAVLLGQEAEGGALQNPKRTDYLEWIKPAKRKTSDKSFWQDGLVADAPSGAYGVVDYYGKPFRVRLDTNGDQQVANPLPDEVAEGRTTLPKRVIVWGAGKDGKWETWDDNPKSWD